VTQRRVDYVVASCLPASAVHLVAYIRDLQAGGFSQSHLQVLRSCNLLFTDRPTDALIYNYYIYCYFVFLFLWNCSQFDRQFTSYTVTFSSKIGRYNDSIMFIIAACSVLNGEFHVVVVVPRIYEVSCGSFLQRVICVLGVMNYLIHMYACAWCMHDTTYNKHR